MRIPPIMHLELQVHQVDTWNLWETGQMES